jgi:hypothetical protein
MTAVFGDFLRPAQEHVAAATTIRDDLPAEVIYGVIGQFGRLLSTLTRYLHDLPAPALLEAAMTGSLTPGEQSLLDARIALRRGTQTLRHSLRKLPEAATDDTHPAVQHLAAAARYLTAGRDLLQTHFTAWPGSGPSYWAPVITSAPVTSALLGELAGCTLRLAPWTARVSAAGAMDAGIPPATCLALHTASQCAWAGGTAMQAAQRQHPEPTGARSLLSAIPANMPPPRLMPDETEQVTALCAGITITAERLRHATGRFARQAGWAPAATSASWRKNALAAAITCHTSEYILRTLADRATQLAAEPAISTQLNDAAAAMSRAWPAWRAIAHHWDTITTGAQPGAPTGPVTTELGDLALRAGRLAYANQRWSPARAHTTRLRDPADLAPAFSDLAAAIGAMHTTLDAITCLAEADQNAVQAAADAGHLYLPVRLLPDGCDIPRRFTPVPPPLANDLLADYRTAVQTSAAVTTLLDKLATTAGAPTVVLAQARQATGLSGRSVSPRLTQADATTGRSPASRAGRSRTPQHRRTRVTKLNRS